MTTTTGLPPAVSVKEIHGDERNEGYYQHLFYLEKEAMIALMTAVTKEVMDSLKRHTNVHFLQTFCLGK